MPCGSESLLVVPARATRDLQIRRPRRGRQVFRSLVARLGALIFDLRDRALQWCLWSLDGKGESKTGSSSDLRGNGELSVVSAHDAIGDRQAQPGPLPNLFHREEGLEDPIHELGRHPLSI